VVAVAAIASGGEDRKCAAGAGSIGAGIATGIFVGSKARESGMLTGGIIAVAVLCDRSARIAGRGRGNGTSRPGGDATACPAKRPHVANTRMSRIAVKRPDPPGKAPGILFGRQD